MDYQNSMKVQTGDLVKIIHDIYNRVKFMNSRVQATEIAFGEEYIPKKGAPYTGYSADSYDLFNY